MHHDWLELAPALGFVALGLVVTLRALTRRAPAPPVPSLPVAKVEDGKRLPAPPAPGAWRPDFWGTVIGLVVLGIGIFAAAVVDLVASTTADTVGRPVRVRGRPRLPRLARGTGWHDDARPRLAGLGRWRPARLGACWLAAARAEHASIPAFERLAHQLAHHGAPVALIARCHAAAADETRHARRCFALARAYAGIDWTAGELRLPAATPIDLETLAVESLVDGCLGEGVAADVARAGAAGAADPVIAESLAMIAADEARHAELAWAVVALCAERGGHAVGRALGQTALDLAPPGANGPVDLGRAELVAIVTARVAAVRARLAMVTSNRV